LLKHVLKNIYQNSISVFYVTESLIFKKKSIKKYMILFNNRVKTKKQMNPVKIYWGVKKNPRKKKNKKKRKEYVYTHTTVE